MLIDFRHLFPKYDIKPRGVLHVGANIGEEAPIYLELGIKKQVWIEPNPDCYSRLRMNLQGNPEASCYQFAAGDVDGEMTLHVANNGGQSSSLLELGTHKIAHPDVHYVADIAVKVMRIDSVFSKIGNDKTDGDFDLTGCDFLNLDVQGYELNVLRGMGHLLNQFRWVYTEVNKNEVYVGCATLESMDLFMTANGFRRVELFNNGGFFDRLNWSDALYIK